VYADPVLLETNAISLPDVESSPWTYEDALVLLREALNVASDNVAQALFSIAALGFEVDNDFENPVVLFSGTQSGAEVAVAKMVLSCCVPFDEQCPLYVASSQTIRALQNVLPHVCGGPVGDEEFSESGAVHQ